MKAKVKHLEIQFEPMTKYDYNLFILKETVQHLENKRIKGFYCNWNGYRFWINEDLFNKLYTIIDD